MRWTRWGAFGLAVLLFAACDEGDEVARPTPTTSPATTSSTPSAGTASAEPAASCRVPAPEATRDTTEIRVFFYCGGGGYSTDPLVPVVRRVPKTEAVLQATIEAWVRGPTAEETAAGFSPGVPTEASWAAVHVTLRGGVALVAIDHDLNSVNNFTTSNMTGVFYRALDANAYQFSGVEAVVITGQCPGEVECVEGPDGPRTDPAARSNWERSIVPCPAPRPTGSLCPRSS